jgi:streptogramin lyase
MRRLIALPIVAILTGCASEPGPPSPAKLAFDETVIEVPGFVDFLLVDGDTIWATNATSRTEGMLEQWSTTGKLASVEMPRPCGTMAMAENHIWQASCPELKVYKINAETAEIAAVLDTGLAEPNGETNIVAGAGSVWVPSDPEGAITRIDPATDETQAKITVEPGTAFLAYGEGALWAVASGSSLLQRVDPETNTVTGSATLGDTPGFLTAGGGAVWVQEQGNGTVAKVDPESLEVVARVKVGDNLKYGDIDVADGKVWLRTTNEQTFVVIDAATNAILARVGRAEGSGAIRYTPKGIWTSAHDVETINFWTETGLDAD